MASGHRTCIHASTTEANRTCEQAQQTGIGRDENYRVGVAELRYVGSDGRTRSWSVDVTALRSVASSGRSQRGDVVLTGNLLGAYFPEHVDANIDRQKVTIDRLLEHLKHDCPEMWDREGPERVCAFAEKQRNPDA